MAKFLSALDERLTAVIQRQLRFFTGSAPQHGRVNVSPKGLELRDWADRKGPGGVAQYQREKNAVSIDGAPLGWGA